MKKPINCWNQYMTKFEQLMLMGGAMFSIVLFYICVFLLSCRLCVTVFSVGLLFFCVSMCGRWLWLDKFFDFCKLCRSYPFLVMVFRKEFKNINTKIGKEGVITLTMFCEKKDISVFFIWRHWAKNLCNVASNCCSYEIFVAPCHNN